MRAFTEATTDTRTLVETVARRLSEIIGDFCIVYELSADGLLLLPMANHAVDEDATRDQRGPLAGTPLEVASHPISRRVLASGKPLLMPRVEPSELGNQIHPAHNELSRRVGLHSILVVALRARGQSLGILSIARYRPESPPFDDADCEMAQMLADHAALALANARLYDTARAVRDEAETSAAALRESEARYRLMFEESPIPKWVHDIDALKFLDANEAACDHFGYRREELLGMTVLDVAAPEHRSIVEAALAQGQTSRAPLTVQLRRKDGAPLWFEARANRLGFGGRKGVLVAANDVTERVTADEARRVAESRFRRLSDVGIIGMLVAGLDRRVIEVNDTLLDMLGYARDELVSGRVPWRELTPADWRDVDVRAIDELMVRGVSGLREKEYLHKDGSRVPVLVGTALLDAATGETISFVLDLSARKEAERALADLRAEQAVQARFAQLLEAAPDAMLVSGLDDRIQLANVQAERLFGYERGRLIGSTLDLIVPPRLRQEQGALRAAYYQNPTLLVAGSDTDLFLQRSDGTEFPAEISLAPIDMPDGVTITASFRDTTARRRAHAAVVRSREAAEASNRELEAFSYSVAHDLRAPLRGMHGFAQILAETYGEQLDALGKDCLDEILKNSRRMAALIDGLLELSRVSRAELKPERLDLSAVMRASVAQLASAEPERQVELVVEDGLTAELDPRLAHPLLDNLAGNAWKFTGKVARARIEFGAVVEEGRRVFFLNDNGAGFDMAFAKKLFAPFQRLHTTREFPGTGIGLAGVQRIIRRHGGEIWAEGRVGEGATFYFTLPGMPVGDRR